VGCKIAWRAREICRPILSFVLMALTNKHLELAIQILCADTAKTCQFYTKRFYMLIVADIATLRLLVLMCDECIIRETYRYTSVNSSQKLIIN
jgi:hypothetical protein